MTLRNLLWIGSALAALVSCDSPHDRPFIPLKDLCDERTVGICAARAVSCEGEEAGSNCQVDEFERCVAEREAFEQEDRLSYDSGGAINVRNEEQAALDDGQGPFPLARYFQGGLVIDDECERDSQCESGACNADTGLCAEPPESALCPEE